MPAVDVVVGAAAVEPVSVVAQGAVDELAAAVAVCAVWLDMFVVTVGVWAVVFRHRPLNACKSLVYAVQDYVSEQ